jgi:vanillate O-demethylase monooxygenase subunit
MASYVLDAWYPLGWSREIGGYLVRRRVCERDLACWRTSGGQVVALEDACPHRLLPLSMGRLVGDNVQCGYHGLTFDAKGHCIRIPGQSTIPERARVPSFPVRESMGLAWVWLGKPENADTTKVIDLPQYRDETFSLIQGDALAIDCNYLALVDNLCDPAHVSFVHLTTLGNAAGEDVPVKHQSFEGEQRLVTWRWIVDAPPIPIFQRFGNFIGNVDRWHYYHWLAPSTAIIDFGSAPSGRLGEQGHSFDLATAPVGSPDIGLQFFTCHFITPVDEHSCIDYWLSLKNFPTDEATTLQIAAGLRGAFEEDKVILEAIEQNEQVTRDWQPITIAIDASPRRMRQMVGRLIAAEGRS